LLREPEFKARCPDIGAMPVSLALAELLYKHSSVVRVGRARSA
jgi:hypothetical protein